MRIVLQRVSEASVAVGGNVVGEIGPGILVLFGVQKGDVETDAEWLANKAVNLRMFPDEQGKMNKNLLDVNGSMLVISQFTLYGNCQSGRRPDFGMSAPSEIAKQHYQHFIEIVRAQLPEVQTGIFGAEMRVSLVNDGPVTFIIDGKVANAKKVNLPNYID